MPRADRRRPLAPFALAVALAVALLATAPAAAQRPPMTGLDPAAGARPEALEKVAFEQRIGEGVPLDLELFDETGRPVRLGELFGERPVALSLVYYECPMLCPMTLDGLARSLKGIAFDPGRDFEVVVVSFDPREGAAEAAEAERRLVDRYGRAGTEAGLHFLTGGEEAIAALTEAVGFRYQYDAARGEYAHGTGLVLLTPEGRIARYFFGIEYPPRDLRLGLVEAGEGRLGNPVDQVLLYCYHYDPVVGKYSAATMNLLRAAAALTLLTLGTFIAVMLLRDRARRARGAPVTSRTA
jgi:protein SCO1/2